MRSGATNRCRKSIWGGRAMLEVRDLHSGYGEAQVLRGVSLDVARGEIVAVLGRNGMGKTTLIRSIMGLTPPQIRSGSITWRGESLVGLRPHDIAARRIAIVPQGRRLFPSLTVTEHLTMLKGARARGGWTLDRVFALFPRLAERRHHRGGQLSGGERGMLAVGRALMIDPELILMDEPSEGLAPVMVQHLEGIVRDLKGEGLSILLVEQNLYSALAVADRVYVLETGQVVHQADAATVAQQTDVLFARLGVS
jgi:branched-chain amino acid transport system ATP-binding protein